MRKGILIVAFIVIFLIVIVAAGFFRSTGRVVDDEKSELNLSLVTLRVNIPCPGHAGLIKSELSKLSGVNSVGFRFPNLFDVRYDSSELESKEILALKIFEEYRAEVVK